MAYLVQQLVVEFMAVVEDVFVSGVQTGPHTVLHHHAGPGGALELLDLNHTHTHTHMDADTYTHRHTHGRSHTHKHTWMHTQKQKN